MRFSSLFMIGLLALAGCNRSSSDDENDGVNSAQGGIDVPSNHDFIQIREVEPNNNAAQSQDLGTLGLNEFAAVAGYIGSDNDRDSFRFTITDPMNIFLSLQFSTDELIDFDIEVYGINDGVDPVLIRTGSARRASEESGAFDLETPEDFAFYDFVAIPKGGSFESSYIYNWVTTTIAPSAEGPGVDPSATPEVALEVPTEQTEASGYGDLSDIDMVGDQVLVSMKPQQSMRDLTVLEARFGLVPVVEIPKRGVLYQAPWLSDREEAAQKGGVVWLCAEMRRDPLVQAVQPNYIYRPFTTEPNDEFYPLQWHYETIRCPSAWDVETGDSSVIVAVIDTGVRFDHPDLGNPGQGVFTDTGYDFIVDLFTSNDGDGIDDDPSDPGDGTGPQPNSYHGTHVCGTISSRSDNVLGVAGVAWNVSIMPLRSLGRGGGTTTDVANAVLYCAGLDNSSGVILEEEDRADILSMSLGSSANDNFLRQSLESASGRDVLHVAAAGNENTSDLRYPAGFDNVMSVSASTRSLTRADYSNFGSWIDITAPGGSLNVNAQDGVLSTFWDDNSDQPAYAYFQGTSMAAPHVAGVASLILSVDPNLNADQLWDILIDNALDIGSPGDDDDFGAGLVDCFECVQAAGGSGGGGTSELSISTDALNFDDDDVSASIVLSSTGSDEIPITSVVDSENSGGDWLILPSNPPTTTPAILDVAVDRAGLENGEYQGTITITPGVGDPQAIQVDLLVDQLDPLTVGNVVVLFTEEDGTVAAQYITGPDDDFQFTFANLPNGTYFVIAGTDENGNFVLNEDGELFGVFPTVRRPEALNFNGGDTIDGLEFTLVEVTGGIGSSKLDPEFKALPGARFQIK